METPVASRLTPLGTLRRVPLKQQHSGDEYPRPVKFAAELRLKGRPTPGVNVSTELLDKRESRIRTMFGAIAPWYDTLNHLLSLNIDRSWRRRTTNLIPPEGTEPILDLCTGTGDLALAYDRAAGGTVPIIGADFCHELLNRAIVKTHKAGAGERISYVEADA